MIASLTKEGIFLADIVRKLTLDTITVIGKQKLCIDVGLKLATTCLSWTLQQRCLLRMG